MPEGKQWPLERLDPVLREQDGFFTTAQAQLAGVSKSKIDRILQAGLVRRVRRGVYVLHRNAPIPRVDERIYSAWLSFEGKVLPWQIGEPHTIVSHVTAASILGIGVMPDENEVHLTTNKNTRSKQIGIALHNSKFDRSDWRWLRDKRIAVTTASRTVIDLAVDGLEVDYIERAASDAIHAKLATPQDIISTLQRSRRRPASGSLTWLVELMNEFDE